MAQLPGERDRERAVKAYLYCTVLPCPVLPCTALYCTVLHCTVLFFSRFTAFGLPDIDFCAYKHPFFAFVLGFYYLTFLIIVSLNISGTFFCRPRPSFLLTDVVTFFAVVFFFFAFLVTFFLPSPYMYIPGMVFYFFAVLFTPLFYFRSLFSFLLSSATFFSCSTFHILFSSPTLCFLPSFLQLKELHNGRAAMMGISGLVTHNLITGGMPAFEQISRGVYTGGIQ